MKASTVLIALVGFVFSAVATADPPADLAEAETEETEQLVSDLPEATLEEFTGGGEMPSFGEYEEALSGEAEGFGEGGFLSDFGDLGGEAMLMSVDCQPGEVNINVRTALGALLDDTPQDLSGTKAREPWFAAFPGMQVFPIGLELHGFRYNYNQMGTIGLVASTSPWPIWDYGSSAPASEADCVAIATSFLANWGNLILLGRRIDELTAADRLPRAIVRRGDWRSKPR